MNGWTIATIIINGILLLYAFVMLIVGHFIKKKKLDKAKKELTECAEKKEDK